MGLNRSSYYLSPATESEENLRLMQLIDQQFLKTPFYGSRRMTASLERSGETVNRKRVQRLMALMGLDAIFPKPRTTVAAPDARVYPYLLRDRVLTQVNEVWSSDITYVPMRHGFMYLTAVIDWFSRYVLSWRLSNTLEGQFCLEALDEALSMGRPEIFNTDQGSQFMARDYTSRLEEAGIAVSRDGRGRALDNVFVERLWRSVKYEDIYIKDYERRTRASLCLGLPDVTPCGIRVGFSISHYIWHPSSGGCRRLVIYEPRDQPDVGTAAGHPLVLRLALQAEGHQPHYRQCLHSVATSRFPPPQVAPVVAG